MIKSILFVSLLAVAFALPAPEAKPDPKASTVFTYGSPLVAAAAPITYSAPASIAYSAAYSAPLTYASAPLTYSAYPVYSAYPTYSGYNAPIVTVL